MFHGQECIFQTPIRFFLNIKVFYFSYLPSTDVDTIEDHVHPFHIIMDRNEEFIFFLWKPFRIQEQKISSKKDCWSGNVKSKNGKILHVKCNNTLTIQHITAKNSVIYRGLEGLNAVLAKTHSVSQTHSCILSSFSSDKW